MSTVCKQYSCIARRRVLICRLRGHVQRTKARTLGQIGRQMGKDPKDAAMDIAIADRGNIQVVIAIMQESDVRAAVSNPSMVRGARM